MMNKGIEDYKGWSIKVVLTIDNREAEAIILNKKLNIAQKIVRKCYRVEIHWLRKEGNFFYHKEVEDVEINYLESETINDLIEEAKTIIDMYDIMKKKILEETKIKELEFGFGKFEVICNDTENI